MGRAAAAGGPQGRNTAKSPYAKESSRMNFKRYDLAPEDELNRILWYVGPAQ